MKRVFFSLILLVLCLNNASAQDIITGINGAVMKAKILEVTTVKVVFKRFDSLTGPTYSTQLSDILSIQYENGKKDSFIHSTVAVDAAVNGDLTEKGRLDAKQYYKTTPGIGAVTLIVAMANPLVGLAPAIAFSSSTPPDYKLNYPNTNLMLNKSYHDAYVDEAKAIKKRKVWRHYGIGVGAIVAFYAVMIGALISTTY